MESEILTEKETVIAIVENCFYVVSDISTGIFAVAALIVWRPLHLNQTAACENQLILYNIQGVVVGTCFSVSGSACACCGARGSQ
ncbi:MAG: hypothetical protein WCI81_06445 [Chlorobiaceae bacterium]